MPRPGATILGRSRRNAVATARSWVGAVALADILLAFVSAQRLILFVGDRQFLAAFDMFPFPLVPLFVVPLILATHALVFARLRDGDG